MIEVFMVRLPAGWKLPDIEDGRQALPGLLATAGYPAAGDTIATLETGYCQVTPEYWARYRHNYNLHKQRR